MYLVIDLLEMFALLCLLMLKLLFTGYENFWMDGWMELLNCIKLSNCIDNAALEIRILAYRHELMGCWMDGR